MCYKNPKELVTAEITVTLAGAVALWSETSSRPFTESDPTDEIRESVTASILTSERAPQRTITERLPR
jgi:hypothetical protein